MSAEVELRIPRGVSYVVRHVDSRAKVTPSEGQYRLLLLMGNGTALVHSSRRECEPLIRRGWVSYDAFDSHGYHWVRITPDGLRALALAVERFGLPEIPAQKAAAA